MSRIDISITTCDICCPSGQVKQGARGYLLTNKDIHEQIKGLSGWRTKHRVSEFSPDQTTLNGLDVCPLCVMEGKGTDAAG